MFINAHIFCYHITIYFFVLVIIGKVWSQVYVDLYGFLRKPDKCTVCVLHCDPEPLGR